MKNGNVKISPYMVIPNASRIDEFRNWLKSLEKLGNAKRRCLQLVILVSEAWNNFGEFLRDAKCKPDRRIWDLLQIARVCSVGHKKLLRSENWVTKLPVSPVRVGGQIGPKMVKM